MDLWTPKSHFEDKLFMKYFNNNFQDTDAVLLKLYPIHNDNFNEKIDQGNQSKRRALSPKPITAYLRVNKDAFLNKREGILNPNIKLKIIEMKIRNKEKLKSRYYANYFIALNKRNIQNDKNLWFNTLRRRNDDNHSYLSTKKEKKKSNILNLKEPLFKFKNSKGFIPYGFKYDANKNKNNSKRDDGNNILELWYYII